MVLMVDVGLHVEQWGMRAVGAERPCSMRQPVAIYSIRIGDFNSQHEPYTFELPEQTVSSIEGPAQAFHNGLHSSTGLHCDCAGPE